MTARSAWTDADMLEALALRDQGLTMAQIGERMGRPRNAIVGMVNRINRETDAAERGARARGAQ